MGAKTGPEIPYQWSPPSRWPRFLPVFALVLLLLPKRNRCWQALWVAAPLLFVLAVVFLLWAVPGIGTSGPDETLAQLTAVPSGLAAVWLLSPYLQGRTRWRTFLRMLATMGVFSLSVCALGHLQDRDTGPAEMLVGAAVFAFLFTLTLSLAGWSCRERFAWRRFCLWLFLWMMVGWLVGFVVMSLLWGPGPLPEMALGLVLVSARSFALLLPFLLLSFNSAFYRERLKELLRLADAAPPSAAPPPPA